MITRLLSTALIFAGASLTALNGFALEIIKDGKPLAEIVVPEKALPQVKFAAKELQEHLLKMSGAKLPITAKPDFENKKQIYVGESKYTRKIGLDTNGLKMEGYKIATGDNYLALLGRDAIFPRYPRGHRSRSDRPRLLKEWQEYCGEKWDFPFLQLYDPRNYNKELGFSLYDPTGTLFAVYEFLEGQGVRWYMPYHEFGTIIPEKKNISAENLNLSINPVFTLRFMRFGWGNETELFLWFKRQKLGMSEMPSLYHGTPNITKYVLKEHPEYLSVINGKLQLQDWNGKAPGHPRLAPPLRDAMIRYGNKFFDKYPELKYFSASPADGYIAMDDRDKASGWWHENRGYHGLMSDYVWNFVNEVAEGVMKTHPDKTVMGFAYSTYRLPPENIAKMNPNVGVIFCQTRCDEMISPETRKRIMDERNEWLKKLSSGKFFIWEYCLYYENKNGLSGIPVVFSKIMQDDIKDLRGKSKGEYVECYPKSEKLWGLKHLPFYLQARLYWNPDLDLKKFMDEYCEKFYGPAKNEMKEFFEFAEEVWMRQEPHNLLAENRFLNQADVDHFFNILKQAKAKAGDSAYGKRINLIIQECQTMKDIFASAENYKTGMASAKAKNGEKAAECFKKAALFAQKTKTKANAWNELGNVCLNLLHDKEKALEAYRKCMSVNLRGAGAAVRFHARMNCVNILISEKRYDEAIKLLDDFDAAKRHAYWKIMALISRGQIAEAQGRIKEAQAKYEEALNQKGIKKYYADLLHRKLENLEKKKGTEK